MKEVFAFATVEITRFVYIIPHWVNRYTSFGLVFWNESFDWPACLASSFLTE